MDRLVGIGECVISDNPKDVLKTYALSTCIGIIVYSSKQKVMGMVHIPLPDSQIVNNDEVENPFKYADTAIKYMFDKMYYKYGCKKEDIKSVKVFGAIAPKSNDYFRIGERNLATVKNELNDIGIHYDWEETGGSKSRTLVAHVETGEVEVFKTQLKY